MLPTGLFIGLVTLDLIYLTENFCAKNEKIVASNHTLAAGGPATNAAVAFSYLGNQARLLGVIGKHPLSDLIREDLATCRVQLEDLNPDWHLSPPVASVIVTGATGDRAVISVNATKCQATKEQISGEMLAGVEIILVDGHQMTVSEAIAQQAKAQNIPLVIDGGSWKPGFEKVLPLADYVICSANFLPPDCHHTEDVFAYLASLAIPHLAITQGAEPIKYISQGQRGQIAVPPTKVVDTLGAGDIFHGAFCHYIQQYEFTEALAAAAKIASYSCQFFGTRSYLQGTRD